MAFIFYFVTTFFTIKKNLNIVKKSETFVLGSMGCGVCEHFHLLHKNNYNNKYRIILSSVYNFNIDFFFGEKINKFKILD